MIRPRLLAAGLGLIVVLSGAAWYGRPEGLRQPLPSTASITRGAADFANGPCIACHTIDGISTGNKGINLTHEGSRRAPDWLHEELLHPTSARPPLPVDQVDDMVAYLSSLK